MKAKAVTKYVRSSPRKARSVANLIRGMNVILAREQLIYGECKPARLLSKTLNSAVANAMKSNQEIRERDLYVTEVRVDEGPYLKRAWSRSKGGRSPIFRKTSHFTIIVTLKES